MEDSMIIELYNRRDEKAIVVTEEKYGAFCMKIAYNILQNKEDSEECVNDTWLKTWNVIPPQLPECLRSFLGRITRNLAFDRYRSDNMQKRGGGEIAISLGELGDCLSAECDVEEEYDLKELGRCINGFLSGLSKRDRDIFLCRYYYSYSLAEIAKKHCIKENYVRNLLSRIRTKLKAHLEKEGYYI